MLTRKNPHIMGYFRFVPYWVNTYGEDEDTCDLTIQDQDEFVERLAEMAGAANIPKAVYNDRHLWRAEPIVDEDDYEPLDTGTRHAPETPAPQHTWQEELKAADELQQIDWEEREAIRLEAVRKWDEQAIIDRAREQEEARQIREDNAAREYEKRRAAKQATLDKMAARKRLVEQSIALDKRAREHPDRKLNQRRRHWENLRLDPLYVEKTTALIYRDRWLRELWSDDDIKSLAGEKT
jgi:hypothetical protein